MNFEDDTDSEGRSQLRRVPVEHVLPEEQHRYGGPGGYRGVGGGGRGGRVSRPCLNPRLPTLAVAVGIVVLAVAVAVAASPLASASAYCALYSRIRSRLHGEKLVRCSVLAEIFLRARCGLRCIFALGGLFLLLGVRFAKSSPVGFPDGFGADKGKG